MTFLKSSARAAAAIALTPSLALADICVTCTGPTASYSCSVKKANQIEALAGASAVNKICAQVLKRKGSHSSCTAETGSACRGTAQLIGWSDVKEALAAGLDDEPKAAPPPASPAKSQPAAKEQALPKQPPPAVQDKQAAPPTAAPPPSQVAIPKQPPSVQEEPSFADKLKGGADKTWKCVSSFFGDC